MLAAFHEVRFPLAVGLGARGGPERRTEIVTLASGREERNARWALARRRYDAGPGVRSRADLASVVAFFEARRGRLHGFRYRDPFDHASGLPDRAPAPTDQPLGIGDGARTAFDLVTRAGDGPDAVVRRIWKPVAGTVRVAVAGVEVAADGFDVDTVEGRIAFRSGHVPPPGAAVTAGFAFDVPVRFDTDRLEVSLTAFQAGEIPSIPLIELVL